MATAADVVLDELNSWWLRFNNGSVDDDDTSSSSDDDDDEEGTAVGEKNVGVVASEGDQMTAAEDEENGDARREGYAAAAVLDEEKITYEETYVHPQGLLQERKRKAESFLTQAECLRAQNEMLRLQLAIKTKELEGEENRRLKLELDLKTKKIKSLRKQIRGLRAENECYKKAAVKAQINPRLCRYCEKYGLHDYRNCPERRPSASSSEGHDNDDDYSKFPMQIC